MLTADTTVQDWNVFLLPVQLLHINTYTICGHTATNWSEKPTFVDKKNQKVKI